jgi:hypothetical protein
MFEREVSRVVSAMLDAGISMSQIQFHANADDCLRLAETKQAAADGLAAPTAAVRTTHRVTTRGDPFCGGGWLLMACIVWVLWDYKNTKQFKFFFDLCKRFLVCVPSSIHPNNMNSTYFDYHEAKAYICNRENTDEVKMIKCANCLRPGMGQWDSLTLTVFIEHGEWDAEGMDFKRVPNWKRVLQELNKKVGRGSMQQPRKY